MNKSITCILAILVITLCLIFTGADPQFVYVGMGIIAALGGVDIIRRRNGNQKP